MDSTMVAIEVSGEIDDQHRLQLDEPLPVAGPRRVRVIVLFPSDDEDIAESVWLSAATSHAAFDFLKDTAEDIYSARDGVPFRDEL